jgi:hypothetical protein
MFFSVYPVFWLAAMASSALAYLAFLAIKKRQTGEWRHAAYRFRFYSLLLVASVLFWGVTGLFTGVRREHVFRAQYEAFAVNGNPQRIAYRLHYVDYPGCFETVYLDELRRYLESARPAEVQLTLETIWDFGTMSSYSLERVDNIRVNAGWSNGQPPWEALRRGTAALR